MKKTIFIIAVCIPIIVCAQQKNEATTIVFPKTFQQNTDAQNFSQKRFKTEIPYINSTAIKPISLDAIIKKVNEDQASFPVKQPVFLNSKFELVTFSIPKVCITKTDIQYFQKKNYN